MSDELCKNKYSGDIYRIIYHEKQSSRQHIASTLGLSLPTVTNVLNTLKENNLIYNAGSFDSTGGRKANILSCVPNARYSIGIDITKNHLSIAVVDLNINLITQKRIRYRFVDSDEYYEYISQEIEHLLDAHFIPRSKLLGVGISMPVIFNSDNKSIFYATVIQTFPGIYDRIKKHLPYPFLLFNDANSAGLAESWNSESNQAMLYLSLSNSVGGATMNGKDISVGNNHRASEFGHMCIIPNGKQCYCGQHGCLDAYCSALILSDFCDGNLKAFFDELETNIGYQRVFDDYLDHLAIGVNNLRVCYDYDIILGGYVGAYMADYVDILREKVVKLNPFETNANFIHVCHYRTEASAVGAAIYFIDKFVQSM